MINKEIYLINGQIISAKKSNIEVINFEQLDINLSNLSTTTIKVPKLQETSTLKLLSCFFKIFGESKICNEDNKKEIIPNLIRRLILPFYIPVIALLCSFLLIKNNILLIDKFLTYSFSFLMLVLTELFIRYTGINNFLRYFYIIVPFSFIIIFYFTLNYKFKKKTQW